MISKKENIIHNIKIHFGGTKMKIYERLVSAQAEFPKIIKEGRSSFGKYANFDSVIEKIRPVLNAHGLFVFQKATSNETGVGIETVIASIDGESISSGVLTIPIMAGGSIAQQCGSVITYAKRYSLCAFLGIATGDDNDGAMQNRQPQVKPTAPTKLVQAAKESAQKGIDAYKQFFESLDMNSRTTLVQSGEHEKIKKSIGGK